MNKKNTDGKRAYHHSEAWLKKHAKKLAAKKTEVKPAKKRAKVAKHAKKQMAKKIDKKHVKKIDKKQMAKKVDKKHVKKIDKKLLNKPVKHTLKSAIHVFDHAKKHVSGLKKCTKQIGKFLTEAMKTGDVKYIAKVQKLFARIGYVYTPENQFVTFENNAKVKLPKVKVAKKVTDKKNPSAKKPRAKKQPVAEPAVNAEVPTCPKTPEVPAPVDDGFVPDSAIEDDADENAELDATDEAEELRQLEKREDETDDEFNERLEEERERLREERELERDLADEEADARAEIFADQEANGDFS